MNTRSGLEISGRMGESAGDGADKAGAPNILFVGPEAEELYVRATRERAEGAAFRKVLGAADADKTGKAGRLGLHDEGAGVNGAAGRAESFIEAILVAGQGVTFDLIIAGIGDELGHLQRAVQSLRTVCPKGRLVLLARPEDEPMARRALAWGANDYQILPITLEKILATSRRAAAPVARESRSLAPTAEGAPVAKDWAGQIKLIHLPLVVQTTMIDALLAGRSDLAERGLAILQSYMSWPGTLEWRANGQDSADSSGVADVPAAPHSIATPAATNGAASAPVRHHGQVFGRLLLHPAVDGNGSAAPVLHKEGEAWHPMASQLNQAALWLGAWVALGQQDEQLRSLAITDELSGAYNRRYFHSFVTGLLEKARVERFRVTLLLFDIDNFKTYNDRFGHAAGDAIIRQLITLLRRCTRENDVVARIGGDEFAVVFWDSEAPRQPNSEHPRDAVAATERLRQAMEKHDWQEGCKIQGSVSISGGIASFPWDADSLETLLAKADAALLRAKGQGKNVVLLHGDCLPEEAEQQ